MSQQPVSFVLHLYWTVTLKWNCSSETYNNLQVKFIHMYLAKSMLVVYFWASLCTLSGLLWYKIVFLIIFFFLHTPYLWKTCLSTHSLFPECDRVRQVQLYWVERWIVRVNLFAKDLDKIIQQGFKWRPLYLNSESSNHHSSTSPKLASRNSHIHPPQGWTLKLQGSERLLRQLNLLSLRLYLLNPLTPKSD